MGSAELKLEGMPRAGGKPNGNAEKPKHNVQM